jgi:hypothetical protein
VAGTTLPRGIEEVELGRVTAWVRDLAAVRPDHAQLAEDIEALLADGKRNSATASEQTLSILQTLPGSHWRRFFTSVAAVLQEIVATSAAHVDQSSMQLRAWASRVNPEDAAEAADLGSGSLHNHSPAMLSAVYFLRAPEEGTGTYFVNPFPQSLVAPAPGTVIRAVEGRLVIFPSWVIHGPYFALSTVPRSPRVTIAIDAHVVPV